MVCNRASTLWLCLWHTRSIGAQSKLRVVDWKCRAEWSNGQCQADGAAETHDPVMITQDSHPMLQAQHEAIVEVNHQTDRA